MTTTIRLLAQEYIDQHGVETPEYGLDNQLEDMTELFRMDLIEQQAGTNVPATTIKVDTVLTEEQATFIRGEFEAYAENEG